MKRAFLLSGLLAVFLAACGGQELSSSTTASGGSAGNGGIGGTGGATGGAGGATGGSTGGSTGGAGGTGGATGGSTGGSTGSSTSTGMEPPAADDILQALRADLQGTLVKEANAEGWPVHVQTGYLFVNTDPKLDKFAGDYDSWKGTQLTPDKGFSYIVLDVKENNHYKFTNLSDWVADPWARAYNYDNNGEISLVLPKAMQHLERFYQIGDAKLEPRTLHILVPAEPPTHVLYTHDGQNLFDPQAFYGGWKIQETAPPAMLVVGIDNTPARMDEYTHVPDVISGNGGKPIGGLGDAYADFLQNTVRPLVKEHYGEPPVVGTMGSSLGGLISFHIADHLPGEFAFAASLSGTMGWGSIGTGIHNQTMIERYKAHGHQKTVLYLDSGGDGGPCGDTDQDGIEDDIDEGDNYCETAQLLKVLQTAGYKDGVDLKYVFTPGAMHNEAEWAARVQVPMQLFAGL